MGQRQGRIRTTLAVVLIAAASIGAACAVAALCLAIAGGRPIDAIGLFATLLSIALAVVSIVYTFRTNRETSELLGSIESKYDSLVGKINAELRNGNYDVANIENLEERFSRHSDDADEA